MLRCKTLAEGQINFFSTIFPPVYVSKIEGITSAATGKQTKGRFIACPYTPKRMLKLPERTVYHKIIQTGQMAEKLIEMRNGRIWMTSEGVPGQGSTFSFTLSAYKDK